MHEPNEPFAVPEELPVLPLRELVVFPYMVLPLFVARESSIAAIEDALAGDRLVLLTTQREGDVEEPGPDDLYNVGTVAMVMRILRMGDGRVKVLVQGLAKARIDAFLEHERSRWVRCTALPSDDEASWSVEGEALIRTVRGRVEELLPLKNLPPEIVHLQPQVLVCGLCGGCRPSLEDVFELPLPGSGIASWIGVKGRLDFGIGEPARLGHLVAKQNLGHFPFLKIQPCTTSL